MLDQYNGIIREMYANAFVISGNEQAAREACALVIALYPEGLSPKAALRYTRQEAFKSGLRSESSYEFLDNSPTLSGEISSVRRARLRCAATSLTVMRSCAWRRMNSQACETIRPPPFRSCVEARTTIVLTPYARQTGLRGRMRRERMSSSSWSSWRREERIRR